MSATAPAYTIRRTGFPRVTWLWFACLIAIFFAAQHDWRISTRAGFGASEQSAQQAASEGSARRRAAFLVLGAAGALGLLTARDRRFGVRGALGFVAVFYFFWVGLSVLWSDEPGLTARRLFAFGLTVLGAVGIAARFSIRQILVWVFVSALAFVLVGVSIEVGLGTFRPWDGAYRFAGTLHPNSQGINCALLLAASLFMLRGANRRTRRWLLLVAIAAFAALMLTKSRTAFFSVGLAMLAWWGFTQRAARIVQLLCWAGAIACLAMLARETLLPAAREAASLGRSDSLEGLTGRLPLWEACFGYANERPLLGYGYGAFWTPEHISAVSARQEWGVGISEAHSAYIELALGLGAVGFAAYVALMLGGSIRSLRLARTSGGGDAGFALVCIGFALFAGLLESTPVYPTYLSFLVLTMLAHIALLKPARRLVPAGGAGAI